VATDTTVVATVPLFYRVAYEPFPVVNVTSGLVALLDFNGTVQDISGHGNHGTATGITYAVGADGLLTTAARFSGITSSVCIADSPSLRSTSATFAVWIRFDGLSNNPYIVHRLPHDQSWQLWCEWNNINVRGGASSPVLLGPSVASGIWYHIAATVHQGVGRIYVDGVERSQGPVDPLDAVAGGVVIGHNVVFNPDPLAWRLQGYVDEFRLYDRALSASEVQSLYSDGPVLP
jgi:hypothetical protein